MSETERLISGLTTGSRRLAGQVLATGENRLELLLVELQEEREHTFHIVGLLLSLAAFLTLAGGTLTLAVVVLLWDVSRIWPVCLLTLLWAGVGVAVYRRLRLQLEQWQSFPETVNQVRRDFAAVTRRLR
ncbi:MAG: phage holin family protein [Verrucomicrobia bacterium]|nr:phage holin family protein [Verrucomicrobiota bacterium]